MAEIMELAQVVSNIGLAAVLAGYFIIFSLKQEKRIEGQDERIQTLLKNNTQAIQDNTIVMTQVNNTLSVMTKEIERLQDDVNDLKQCTARYK